MSKTNENQIVAIPFVPVVWRPGASPTYTPPDSARTSDSEYECNASDLLRQIDESRRISLPKRINRQWVYPQ